MKNYPGLPIFRTIARKFIKEGKAVSEEVYEEYFGSYKNELLKKERAYEEGATFTLTNTAVALRMGDTAKLAEKCNTVAIEADATKTEDLKVLFEKSMEHLGGKVDFVLHSIGMSPNVRKGRHYSDLDYNMLEKTLDISAVSFHKVLQVS